MASRRRGQCTLRNYGAIRRNSLTLCRPLRYIPSELGYGERGSPPKIGGGDVLVFTMEIMKIKGGKKPASKCDVGSLEGCTEKESKYVSSKRGLPGSALDAEVKRLHGMAEKPMADKQLAWLNNRVHLLTKLIAKAPVEELR